MSEPLIDRSTRVRYGTWPCSRGNCDALSPVPYRCQTCGHPLEGDTETAGREDRQ